MEEGIVEVEKIDVEDSPLDEESKTKCNIEYDLWKRSIHAKKQAPILDA